ncbi:MAG: hypothetical protein EA373_01445, partial [Oceanospirillales bacterium]
RSVTQGISITFLLFFYCATLSAEVRVNQPIQLVVETDRNQLYQHSQLIVTLHIFHEEPLPETVDIIPPQLDEGRVRTLGLPYTRVEPGPSDYGFHTTQNFALFPDQVGELSSTGPSIRFPSPFNNGSQVLTTDIPAVNVIAKPEGFESLISENLILSDTTHPLSTAELGFIRRVSVTAVGTLPHQLPDRILDPLDRQDYRLIERMVDEFHSRQGVTSLLQELWHVTPTAGASSSQPVSSVIWWDTESQSLRQAHTPPPSIGTAELLEEAIVAQEVSEASEAVIDAQRVNQSPTQQSTPFWLQVAVGFTLLTVVSLAILAGFKFQLGRKNGDKASRTSLKGRLKESAKPNNLKTNTTQTSSRQAERANDPNALKANAELLAFQGLMTACQQNACHQAKKAIVLWAACFWPDKRITQTESIYQANVSQTLNYLLLDLEHHIKQSQESAWRGDLLLEAVKTLRRRRFK